MKSVASDPADEHPKGPAPASNREWLTSIGWTAAGKWGAQLFSWACSLLIARLLAPDDFGLLTMTVVFLGLVSLLAEAGIGSAVLNLPQLNSSQIRQLNTISIGFSASGALTVLATSRAVAAFFGRPELVQLLSAMSIPLLLSGMRAVPNAVMQKALRFKLLSGLDALQALVQALVTVALAYCGFGYWSLALGSISGAVVSTAITVWLSGPGLERPRKGQLSHLASFSSAVLVSNLSWFAYANADFIIAGKMLGAAALGHYSLAWNLAVAPSDKIGVVITKVTPGFLARHSASHEGIRRDVCRLTKGTSMLVSPLAIGLALVADTFVATVLGDKWLPAIAPLRYLCVYLLFAALFTVLPQAAVSAGKPSLSMFASLLKLVVLPVAFYIGSHWGAKGIAVAWLGAGLPATLPLYILLFRLIHLPVWEYLRATRTAFLGTCFMAIMVVCARALLSSTVAPMVSLVTQIAVGCVAYAVATLYLEPQIRTMITSRMRRACE